jgi:hypothetical protein
LNYEKKRAALHAFFMPVAGFACISPVLCHNKYAQGANAQKYFWLIEH